MAEEIQSPNGYIITTYKNRLGHLESTEERAADGSKERLTQYQTNRFGQVTRKEVEDGSNSRVWEYRYNLDGKLVFLVDPELNRYEYLYDPLGNLLSVRENGEESATYT
ncbi:hypothetical protein MXD63_40035, partial [Frankia sp. Cpl3]|nr:hypothetical protein [Frankia sp. Cpl3]